MHAGGRKAFGKTIQGIILLSKPVRRNKTQILSVFSSPLPGFWPTMGCLKVCWWWFLGVESNWTLEKEAVVLADVGSVESVLYRADYVIWPDIFINCLDFFSACLANIWTNVLWLALSISLLLSLTILLTVYVLNHNVLCQHLAFWWQTTHAS